MEKKVEDSVSDRGRAEIKFLCTQQEQVRWIFYGKLKIKTHKVNIYKLPVALAVS